MYQPELTAEDFEDKPTREPLPEGFYEAKIGKFDRHEPKEPSQFNPDKIPSTVVMLEIISKANDEKDYKGKFAYYYIRDDQKRKWANFYKALGYSKGWIVKNGQPPEAELLDALVKVEVTHSDSGKDKILMKGFLKHKSTLMKQLEEEDIPF